MASMQTLCQLSEEDKERVKERGYNILRVISHGSCSLVYLCEFKKPTSADEKDSEESQELPTNLVCKVMETVNAPKDFVQKFLPRELANLSRIRSGMQPHIIHVHSILQYKSKVMVFMRHAELGNLCDYIKNRKDTLSEKLARFWFRQLATALSFLHTMEVAHRDIKCENVLVTANHNVKLCDFGFSRLSIDSRGKQIYSTTYCGSMGYAAPELLKGMPYNPKISDVWSLVAVRLFLINLSGGIIFQVNNVFSRKLVEEFSWNEIDFEFNTPYDRKTAIETELFIRGASIPTSLEVWNDRMFIATPRIKPGVPSTLNYISLSDVNTKSPKLTPYPSWEMNNNANKSSKKVKMTSIYNIRADPCNRLWALDTGISEEATTQKVETPPIIFVFSLNENALLRKYTLQETEYNEDSKFRFLVVDVTSGTCENAFAYIADTKNGLVVYSWYTNKSFRVKNNYFSFEPVWGNFKTSTGQNVQLSDGLFGMALTLPDLNGHRQLLFHPMVGTHEYRVSTKVLQNRTLATSNFTDFYLLGSRGTNSQSTASFMDLETGVLVYTTLIQNGVSCWNQFKGESLTPENQGIIDVFPYEYSFPYDLKIDKNGTLWVLTNRLLDFLHEKQDGSSAFRIYSGFVRNIIKGTPCEEI